MTMNTALSAIPFAVSSVMNPIGGFSVDWLRSSGKLSTNVVRKIFCAAGFTLSGCFFVAIGYTGCNVALAVTAMCAVLACKPLAFSSVGATQLDLAPLHAGKIMGVTYTVANLGSIAAPIAASAFTYTSNRHAHSGRKCSFSRLVSSLSARSYSSSSARQTARAGRTRPPTMSSTILSVETKNKLEDRRPSDPRHRKALDVT